MHFPVLLLNPQFPTPYRIHSSLAIVLTKYNPPPSNPTDSYDKTALGNIPRRSKAIPCLLEQQKNSSDFVQSTPHRTGEAEVEKKTRLLEVIAARVAINNM
jgi:hypothetical protein